MIQVEQFPIPPVPPVPPEIMMHGPMFMSGDEIAKIVIVSMAGLAAITWIIARGPIGHAIGAILTRWAGGGKHELPGEVEDLRHQLDQMQHQYAELAERQDFAERMLADLRRQQLPGSADVKG
jgi:hypothetical protein